MWSVAQNPEPKNETRSDTVDRHVWLSVGSSVAVVTTSVWTLHSALLLLTPVTETQQETAAATRRFPDTRRRFNNFCH